MTQAPGLPDPIHDARFYEGVALRRLGAFLLDLVFIGALSAGTVVVFGVATLGLGFMVAAPLVIAVSFLYRAVSLAMWSATPGMALSGVEMRRFDGMPFSAVEAVGHTLLFMVFFALVLPQLVSIFLMFASTPGRALHDLPFGSTAINRPA